MGIETKIENSQLLTDIFGRWPSFHDSEVMRIVLNRGDVQRFDPYLEATIHVFQMTAEVDEHGKHVLKNHTAVTFRFIEIYELSLEDFNQQNVMCDLSISDISDHKLERIKFNVSFDGIFGVSAKFQCNSICVESVEPFVRE